ncbi:uncharacterized protein LOC120075103 [Benincasa hispida]|uniref:uncharacterized protein LOC120075103 n=1 Tax=Benincasa hispida TaxID=102211 RepID=UPI0019027DDF|nr:uncharacterized protein LOC120075103 [Benincasa hispida]
MMLNEAIWRFKILEKGDGHSLRWWKAILLFMGCSGLNLNVAKSSLIGINIKEHKVFRLVVELGCKMESLLLNYLGFSLGGKHWSLTFCDPSVDKIRSKIVKRKNSLLSKGGRLSLISSVLNGFPCISFPSSKFIRG